jgi:hypothetical protein
LRVLCNFAKEKREKKRSGIPHTGKGVKKEKGKRKKIGRLKVGR